MNKETTKHTPGPWKARDCFTNGQPVEYAIETRDAWLASVHITGPKNGFDCEEAEANARLIAAAPELLEALKKVLPLVESLVLDGEPYMNEQEEARDAIAKATGENL